MGNAAWWRMRGTVALGPICLCLAGVLVLAAGLVGAAMVYSMPWRDESWQLAGAMPDTKLYETRLESIGGRATFLAAELTRWLGGFWHGRPLAIGLMILCTAIALGCFVAAHRLMQAQRARGADARR